MVNNNTFISPCTLYAPFHLSYSFHFALGKETNALNTSTCSDSAVTRRRRKNVSSKLTSSSESTGSENRLNRLSLAGTSVYAGHLSSLVLGKIKSLWSVNSNSTDGGLNQFSGRTPFSTLHLHCFCFIVFLFDDFFRFVLHLRLVFCMIFIFSLNVVTKA